jgi:hypothetical protein
MPTNNKRWELHQQTLLEFEHKKKERKETSLRKSAEGMACQPIDISRYRNERNLMLFPFCSTSKRKRTTSIKYRTNDGKRWLEVTANAEYGMVKIWDFDILRFALSKAGEIARKTGYFPAFIEFTAYECLKALGRNPESGKNIAWLEEALRRLCSTTYCGNIFREDEKTTTCFTLISVSYVKLDKGIEKIRVTFNERLQDSIRLFNGLLAINPGVLREEAGIKKRLLELVTVSIGKESSWTASLERLQTLCAHEGTLKRFKYELTNYNLPWKIYFSKAVGGNENVTFSDISHKVL